MTTQPPTSRLSLREQMRLPQLVADLADPDCTDWTCPNCERVEYKGARNGVTGEFVPYSLVCDGCGFDATEYAPADGVAHT